MISALLEQIEKTITKFQNLLDHGANSKDIIRKNIEKILVGKDWKEYIRFRMFFNVSLL